MDRPTWRTPPLAKQICNIHISPPSVMVYNGRGIVHTDNVPAYAQSRRLLARTRSLYSTTKFGTRNNASTVNIYKNKAPKTQRWNEGFSDFHLDVWHL